MATASENDESRCFPYNLLAFWPLQYDDTSLALIAFYVIWFRGRQAELLCEGLNYSSRTGSFKPTFAPQILRLSGRHGPPFKLTYLKKARGWLVISKVPVMKNHVQFLSFKTRAVCPFLWMSDPQNAVTFRGASPLTPWPGALPLDPAGGSAPDSRYRLALSARHGQGPSTFLFKFTPMWLRWCR